MVEEPIFQCIGMLATSVGPNLTKLLHDQLDLMFACGLTEPLRQALVAIARHIPPLLRTIQGSNLLRCPPLNFSTIRRPTTRYAVIDSVWTELQTTWRSSASGQNGNPFSHAGREYLAGTRLPISGTSD